MAKISSKWEESKPIYAGQDQIRPEEYLGEAINNSQFAVDIGKWTSLTKEKGKKTVLLKLILLPQSGEPPSSPTARTANAHSDLEMG